ncbi:hypothetical protein KM043_016838 [Ampulex compressa]|nr:hypothetical protein KM043_016838 [Ampulex compressa]
MYLGVDVTWHYQLFSILNIDLHLRWAHTINPTAVTLRIKYIFILNSTVASKTPKRHCPKLRRMSSLDITPDINADNALRAVGDSRLRFYEFWHSTEDGVTPDRPRGFHRSGD